MVTNVLAATSGSGLSGGERGLFLVAGLIATWCVIWFFFHREKGGMRAEDGGPGGSEKDIVGATIFLAAVIVGILVATR